jgi:hypothetical protein
MGQDMVRLRSGHFRPSMKTVLSRVILGGGQKAFILGGQVLVRSGTEHLGSLKEATFVPRPKPRLLPPLLMTAEATLAAQKPKTA